MPEAFSDHPNRTETGAARNRVAVVAFGGNAILRAGQRGTVEEQSLNLAGMARQLAEMIEAGWGVVVTHGNGPQVGNIQLQQEAAEPAVPGMPLDVCGAMSQGQIGYLLGQAISREFAQRGIRCPIVSLITQCVVDPRDPAFANPTKPIGPFYDQETAERLREEKGWSVVPDSGRGYRRVVPSPAPQRIVESESIRALASSGSLVIASGGGGIPVVATGDGAYEGIEAVIDKDLAACLLAREVGAHTLVLLTETSNVFVDFGTRRQRSLEDVSMEELQRLAGDGHFPAGSMGPKIQGAIQFLEGGGNLVIITSPLILSEALAGRAGTRVHRLATMPAAQSAVTMPGNHQ